MIPFDDWDCVYIPGLLTAQYRYVSVTPRRFKWTFKDFKKAIKGKKLKKAIRSQIDKTTVADMEMMHGGRYWPTTGGGLIAIPYDSKKFKFNEWT